MAKKEIKQEVPDVKICLTCECGDPTDHVVYLSQDNDNDWGDYKIGHCLISTSLNHCLPFWKRIVLGFKYILGIDNTYIFYTETVLKVKDLKDAVSQLKDESDAKSNENNDTDK